MSSQRASRTYYAEEERTYRTAYDQKVSDEDAKVIIKKLWNHCHKEYLKAHGYENSSYPNIKLWGYFQGGAYRGWANLIRLSHIPSMGLIIHEFAHYAKRKSFFIDILDKIEDTGTRHHGLHFQICLTQLHNYAQSKNYWADVIKKKQERRQNKSKIAIDNANVL
jgi:hypothetical protein